MGGDLPANGFVLRADVLQAPARAGVDDDALEARRLRIGVDAGHKAKHPLADRAQGIVVERVHPRILEPLIFRPAIPTLPDGRGALLDGVAPGGERLVVQQSIGDFVFTGAGKSGAQVPHADEARGQVAFLGGDVVDQATDGPLAKFVWQQAHVQGQEVAGLGVALDAPVRRDIGIDERLPNGAVQVVILAGVLAFANGEGHLAHQSGVVGEVGGGDDVLGRVGGDGEPVAVVVVQPLRAQQAGIGLADVLNPPGHRLVMLFDDAPVAVHAVDGPRHDDAGVSPGRRAVSRSDQTRGHVRERAAGGLGVAHVPHPLGEEGGDVHVVCGGPYEDLGVPQPAQPFVALGAVGRDAQEVAALSPPDVALELVDHGVGALELADRRRVGMQDDAGDGVLARPAGIAGQLHVTKAVEGEARFIGLLAVALQRVDVCRFGGAQIGGVDAPVGIKHLRESQRDLVPSFAPHPQAGPTHHVLREVEDEHARLRLRDRLGFQLFRGPHGTVRLRDELRGRRRLHGDGLPVGRIVAGGGPGAHLLASVVGLAHQHVGVEDRPRRPPPALVANEGLPRAVRVLHLKLQQQRGMRAVVLAFAGEADVAGVPPVAQDGAQGIGSFLQQVGDVVSLILNALLVVGPTRRQMSVSNPPAVDLQLVDASRRGVQSGATDGLPQLDLPPQEGRRRGSGRQPRLAPRTATKGDQFLRRRPLAVVEIRPQPAFVIGA